jgi:hypothetical protein
MNEIKAGGLPIEKGPDHLVQPCHSFYMFDPDAD